MKDFQGKVAVVTGAASGIGRAMVRDFAKRGMKIVGADIEAGPLEQLKSELASAGVPCLTVRTDVSKLDQVKALADAAYRDFGAVHVLCNNAGVAVSGPMAQASHSDWQWVLGVNLWGVIHGIEAFLPRMIAAKQGGHIVNTASMAGLIASKDLGVYNTSKYAVVGLSETLIKEAKEHGIGVSVICPMGVKTGITESARNRPADLDSGKGQDIGLPLLGDYLQPEEVSRRVLQAVESGEFYVFTHPEAAEFIERRFERIRKTYQAFR